MTQEELKIKIIDKIESFVSEIPLDQNPTQQSIIELAEDILRLRNKDVAEVIGENEPESKTWEKSPIYEYYRPKYRNELKEEQRKRAELSITQPTEKKI